MKVTKIDTEIQDLIISKIKHVMPPRMGLAEEVADVLQLSIDSAYRRIRGETELTLGEACKLLKKHNISLDSIIASGGNMVTFPYIKLTDSAGNFEAYLHRITAHLKMLNNSPDGKIYYVAEETPLFYSFFSKKLADFKLFYWQRSVLNIPEYQDVNYVPGFVPQILIDMAHNIYIEYLAIPSIEVWTDGTVYTGTKQITFYFESGIITKDQALELLGEYRKMTQLVQKNAEIERKNISDKNPTFTMYRSEVVLGTNCIYTVTDNSKHSFISFNTLNSLATSNPEFCEETEHWLKNILRKSTQISGVSEKERYRFFSGMLKHIDQHIDLISKE